MAPARILNVRVKLDDAMARQGLASLGVSGGNIMKGLGVAAAAAATAVTGIGIAGVNAALELDKKMGEVQTLLNKTLSVEESTRRAEQLRTAIQDLAMETGRGTDDMAQGLYDVISAIGDTDDAMQVLEISAKAAAAGVGDTGSTVKLLTGIAKAYGDMSPEFIGHLADLAFETVRLGVTTLPEMAGSMGKAAVIANEMNVPVEELFATLAAFSGQGRDTAEVVTTMTSAMNTALKPSSALSGAFEYLSNTSIFTGDKVDELRERISESGRESASAGLKELGLANYLRLLKDVAPLTGEELGKLTGRKEATGLALQFASDQYDTFLLKQDEMINSGDAGERAWDRMTEGIGGTSHKLDILKTKWDVMLERIGELILKEGPGGASVIDDISKAIGNMADALADPNSDLSQLITDLKELVGFIWDGIMAVKGFTDSVRGAADWFYQSDFGRWLINTQGTVQGIDVRAGNTPATQAFLDNPTGGEYIPQAYRGTSGVMKVEIVNTDIGSTGLLEAING